MHFKPNDIRGLTFRRRLFGYRTSDVKDFMNHVVDDYETYQEKESQIVVYQHELETAECSIQDHQEEVATLGKKNKQLKKENERLQDFELEVEEIEKMKQMAQQTADAVQTEVQNLLEEAEEKKERIIKEAESTKMNHLLNAQIELGELMNEQEQIKVQVANKKLELFELEEQYEETLNKKDTATRETQLMKQEFISLRSKLIQKYVDGIDAFIEENQLNQSPNESPDRKVMTLTTKRIG